MRILVNHDTVYHYEPPALGAIQTLRLTPRGHDGQYVVGWRVEVSESCHLKAHTDAFGNLTHTFAIEGPLSELRVSVIGEVETQDTAGVIRGTVERFPPSMYLRATDLTTADAILQEFALTATEGESEVLGKLHALMAALHDAMSYDEDTTQTGTSAPEAFALKRGVCQDYAHIYLACARHLGIPARYVSGYLADENSATTPLEAGHAWTEAHVDGFGWIAFDPVNKVCATEAHVRVALGLDYLGAAPVRGNRYGGGGETLTVAIKVDQSSRQVQG